MAVVSISSLHHDGGEFIVLSYPLARPACFSELTAAELGVVEGVLEGRGTREIARECDISARTVTKHLTHAYRKLQIGSRAELVALVAQAHR